MKTKLFISFVTVYWLFIWSVEAQKSSYVELSTTLSSDRIKLNNGSGKIYESEISPSLVSGISLGYSSPLYKSLRFRSDLIFFQSENRVNVQHDYDDILTQEIRTTQGSLHLQSILLAWSLEYHYNIRNFIFGGQAGSFVGMDSKKSFSNNPINNANILRSGFLLGAEIKYVKKLLGIGLGVNYLNFDSDYLQPRIAAPYQLRYDMQSLMGKLTVSYKIGA